MKTKTHAKAKLPTVVSAEKWQAARAKFLRKEKALMQATDALAAARRRLPMERIAKTYRFDGPNGEETLLDLFAGRRQLILYHFMFAPDVPGWPDAGCTGCSMMIDNFGHPAHLHARNTSIVLVSRASLKQIERFRQRMGWKLPWYSSARSDFNEDFGRTTAEGEMFGLSVFLRDGSAIYRTYFTEQRGVEPLGTVWSLLDVTPFGRQETWEKTPPGRTRQTPPFRWWRRHDEYE